MCYVMLCYVMLCYVMSMFIQTHRTHKVSEARYSSMRTTHAFLARRLTDDAARSCHGARGLGKLHKQLEHNMSIPITPFKQRLDRNANNQL